MRKKTFVSQEKIDLNYGIDPYRKQGKRGISDSWYVRHVREASDSEKLHNKLQLQYNKVKRGL